MFTRPNELWREMDQLQNEMNRLFESYTPRRRTSIAQFPAINLWASDEAQVVTAELPGVDLQNVEVSVVGDVLTITGKRLPDDIPDEAQFYRRERGEWEFSRSIQLPYVVDPERVEANLEKGVLRILLPRAEADKPKKIMVKSAA